MSTNHKEWMRAASRAVGVHPEDLASRGALEAHAKAVWLGIMKEHCPDLTLKQLSKMAQFPGNAHSTAHCALARWKKLGWRERYGWLILADSLYGSDTDRKAWSIKRLADASIETVDEVADRVREKYIKPNFEKIRIPGHYDGR